MELDVVQELQSYCSTQGLPKPLIQETLEYPYTYVTLISIGGKKAMSRGDSARIARERAALKWMKLYGQPDIRISPPETERKSSLSSPMCLDKSAGARAKSIKADNMLHLQVDATGEDGTSEEDDPGELRDPGKKTLLKKVFGNSPITKRSPFKRSNKKSDRKKTSPPVSVDPDHRSSASDDDDHKPPPSKKSASMKKKIFSAFKESPKKGKSEKPFKFQFKRDYLHCSHMSILKYFRSNRIINCNKM